MQRGVSSLESGEWREQPTLPVPPTLHCNGLSSKTCHMRRLFRRVPVPVTVFPLPPPSSCFCCCFWLWSGDRSHAANCGNPHFHALVAFSRAPLLFSHLGFVLCVLWSSVFFRLSPRSKDIPASTVGRQWDRQFIL